MGAGLSWKTKRSRMYGRLKTVERKLKAKGISCQYTNLEVRGEQFVVYFASCGTASNGESCAWLVLRFNPNQQPCAAKKQPGDIDFTNFHTRDIPEHSKGGWDAGVQRVLENRLEYLRGELRAERISYDEIAELQGLVRHIKPGDVELLEAAGVPEQVLGNGTPDSKWQWMDNAYGPMGWFSDVQKAEYEGTAEFTNGHWRAIDPKEVAAFHADVKQLAYEQS